jgi:hypothetical protein
VLVSDKRWLKVRLFGNFVKSAQYKKHIGRLFLQLLKPKQLLTQPWSNGGQMSDFRQFRKSQPGKKRLFCLLLQLRKSERLLTRRLFGFSLTKSLGIYLCPRLSL